MPTLTINPFGVGNIITAADTAAGVTFTGTETGLDGQQIYLSLFDFNTNSELVSTIPIIAENGRWSVTLNLVLVA